MIFDLMATILIHFQPSDAEHNSSIEEGVLNWVEKRRIYQHRQPNVQYRKKVMSQIGFAPLFRDFGIQRKSKISNCAT